MDEKKRKELFKQTFDTVADGYDNAALRFFPESAKQLASFLDLRGSEHILDVATGTGNVALTLADSLPDGQVTGIDFSQGMLKQAKTKKTVRNIRNVEFLEMDMQVIDFPDNHFDAATCAFSIFFLEDMQSQISHIAEKVKLGGNIVTTTFQEETFLPLVVFFLDKLGQYGVEIPPMVWKRVATKEKCAALFEDCALKNVRSEQNNHGYYLKNAHQWWDLLWNAGYRGLISQLSDDDMEKFKKEHLEEIQKLATKDGIWMDVIVLYTLGTKM